MSPSRARVTDPPSPLQELRICKKLALSPAFFSGLTTLAERAERLRRVIVEKGVQRIPAFRGSDETWAEAFQRWYGEPISQPTQEP